MAPETIADHLSPQAGLVGGWELRGQEEGLSGAAASTPLPASPHNPAPAWGLPCMCRATQLLPEDGGAGTGVPSHTEHTQALGQQHKGQ